MHTGHSPLRRQWAKLSCSPPRPTSRAGLRPPVWPPGRSRGPGPGCWCVPWRARPCGARSPAQVCTRRRRRLLKGDILRITLGPLGLPRRGIRGGAVAAGAAFTEGRSTRKTTSRVQDPHPRQFLKPPHQCLRPAPKTYVRTSRTRRTCGLRATLAFGGGALHHWTWGAKRGRLRRQRRWGWAAPSLACSPREEEEEEMRSGCKGRAAQSSQRRSRLRRRPRGGWSAARRPCCDTLGSWVLRGSRRRATNTSPGALRCHASWVWFTAVKWVHVSELCASAPQRHIARRQPGREP